MSKTAFSLGEFLQNPSGFNTVEIVNANLNDADCVRLAAALKTSNKVSEVILSSNQIGDIGAAALVESLKCNNIIGSLDVDDNQISEKGIALLNACGHRQLEIWDGDQRPNVREAVERAAREKAAREAAEQRAAHEKAIYEANQRAAREAAERAAREKATREAAERAAREKATREAAERAAREKAVLEANQKAAREAAEQAAREKAIYEAKQKAEKEAHEFSIQAENDYEARSYATALLKYEAAITLDPFKDYYVGKAAVLKELGRYDEAIEAVDKVLTIDPNYEAAKEQKELILDKQQKEEIMKIQEHEAKEAVIKEIFNLIGEGGARIQDNQDDQADQGTIKKAILVMGRTGAGKSTLVHLLTDEKLQGIVDDSTGNMIIAAVDPLPDITIGHRAASETKIPGKQKFGDIDIWDVPGFKDTGGIEQEITNAYYIRRLCEITDQLKIVLTMPESAIIDERGSNAIAIIEQFARVFTDIKALENCVSLVVTRVPSSKKAEHLVNHLKKIMQDNPLFQNNINAKQVADYLLKSVHVFNTPTQEGMIMNNGELLSAIQDSTDYIASKADMANIAIENTSIPYAKELLATSQFNLEKVTDIIVRAIKEANFCMSNVHEKNVFNNSSEIIKNWLPKSFSVNTARQAINNQVEHFANLDQLSTLTNALHDAYDSETVKQTVVNILNVFQDFGHSPGLKLLIQQYIHIFQQQMGYVEFLSNVCEHTVDYSHLMNAMKGCKAILNNELKTQVTSLELKDHTDLAYYTKAIKYLDLYPEEATCTKIKAQCYDHIGSIKEAQGNYKQAIANYAQALKLDKSLTDTYKKMGELLFNDKDYAEALKYFKVAGNTIKSAECFEELIKENPKDASLRFDKGDYYLSIGRNDKAIGCYQDAYSLSNDKESRLKALNKESNAMKDHGQKLISKAAELDRRAESGDFCNFDEFKIDDLDNYPLSVIGSTEEVGIGYC